MKKIGLSLLGTLLLILIPFSVSAAVTVTPPDSNLSVSLPDNYTILTSDNLDQNTSFLNRIGQTPDTMSDLFASSGYLLIAISDDLRYEISLISISDELSQSAWNLLNLPIAERETMKYHIAGSLLESGAEVKEIEKDGALFYRIVQEPQVDQPELTIPSDVTNPVPSEPSVSSEPPVSSESAVSSASSEASNVSDTQTSSVSSENTPISDTSDTGVSSDVSTAVSEPTQPSEQPDTAHIYYITLFNGRYYTLCFTDQAGVLTENDHSQIDYVFNSLQYTIEETALKEEITRENVLMSVIIVIIALAIVIIVWIIISLRSELHRRKLDSDWRSKSRPRPRR